MKSHVEQPRFLKALELMSKDVQKEFIILLYNQSNNPSFDYNSLFNSSHFCNLNSTTQKSIKDVFHLYCFTCISNENSIVFELNIKDESEVPCIIKLEDTFFNSSNNEALTVFGSKKIEGVSLVTSYKIIDITDEDGPLLLFMPKAGNNVKQYLQNPNNTRPIEECFWIYSNMALALQSMCANGVFFPDLKNTNWQYVTSNTANFGKLMLADTKSLEVIPSEGIFTESLHTRPPECRRPSNKDQAEAYSVYGWAINFIESLTGQQITIPNLGVEGYSEKIFESRDQLLECIKDPKLKKLLKGCIDSKPEKRPKFKDICDEMKFYETRSFPIIDQLNKYLRIADVFDQNLSEYLNNIKHCTAINDYQFNSEKLEKLKNCKHLQEFYKIIHALADKKATCFLDAGYDKANKVMQAFVQIPVEDRLDPNAAGWQNVMHALEIKRGFFSSSSSRSFKNCLDSQKALNNTQSNAKQSPPTSTPGNKL